MRGHKWVYSYQNNDASEASISAQRSSVFSTQIIQVKIAKTKRKLIITVDLRNCWVGRGANTMIRSIRGSGDSGTNPS